MVNFVDFDTAKVWLSTQEKDLRVCLAARAALRVLPELSALDLNNRSVLMAKSFRAIIVAVVSAHMPLVEMKPHARAAASDGSHFQPIGIGPTSAAFNAAIFAAEAASTFSSEAAATAIARSVAAISLVASASLERNDNQFNMGMATARLDGKSTSDFSCASDVFKMALWSGYEIPEAQMNSLQRFRKVLKTDQKRWAYWDGWYEGYLRGEPPNWSIQLAIAQLPEDDWLKGPLWIADKIAEIEARFALQKRIAELETALLSENVGQRGIGDNHPPEPIDDISDVPPELVIVWEPLQTLRQETEADVPDAGRVRRAIMTLVDIAVSCGAWTWEKANMFLDAGLKAGGAAASVALVTGHGDMIVAVIKAAIEWLTFWA